MYKYVDEVARERKNKKVKRFLLLLTIIFALTTAALLVDKYIITPKNIGKSIELKSRILNCTRQARSKMNEITDSVTSITASDASEVRGLLVAIDEMSLVYFGGNLNNRPAELNDHIDKLKQDIDELFKSISISRQSQVSLQGTNLKIRQDLETL